MSTRQKAEDTVTAALIVSILLALVGRQSVPLSHCMQRRSPTWAITYKNIILLESRSTEPSFL